MAEWSKALVLGTSHFGGAGSNPVPVIIGSCKSIELRVALKRSNVRVQLRKSAQSEEFSLNSPTRLSQEEQGFC